MQMYQVGAKGVRAYQVEAGGHRYSGTYPLRGAIALAKEAERHFPGSNPRIFDAGTDWNAIRGHDVRELRCRDCRVGLRRAYDIPGITYIVYSGSRYLGLLIKDAHRQWRYKTCHDRTAQEMGGFTYSHTAVAAMINQFPSECLSKWL